MLPFFAAAESWEGRKIAAIRFQPGLQPLPAAQLQSVLPIRVGSTYNSEAIRHAIQSLYATGEYTDIAVDATPEKDGIAITFITKQATFVGRVSVSGAADPPGNGQLENAARMNLGAEYVASDVPQAAENMQDALRRNGLYKATVTPNPVPHPLTQEMDVRFLVNSGRRASFDGIEVTGDPQRPIADIIHGSGWKWLWGYGPWRTVTDTRVQSGIDSMRSYYEKHDHLLAHVTLTRLDFNPRTNRVTPTLDISAGPAVRVNVEGAHVSQGRLRSLLPIFQERAIDEDLLIEGRKDLVEYLQSQGFFNATAEYTTHAPARDQEVITYDVQRGARHRFVALRIAGNHYFTTSALRERMFLTPAEFIRFPRGRYSPDDLERDLDSIRGLYRSNGFRDVEVTSRTIDNYRGKPSQLAIFINIREGPQWFVSRLTLHGIAPGDTARVLPLLHSTEGQPFSELNVASDRDALLDYYYNDGYSQATFEYAAQAASEPHRMEVTYTINPGPQRFVRRVVVIGLNETNPDLVDSRISVKAGDPISAAKMNESQRRLYDLGIFSKVQTAIQNPDGDEPSKYILYDVDEAHDYSFNVGVGAEIARIGGGTIDLDSPAGTTGFAPRLTMGISRLNVFGRAHTVSLQTLISTFEQRALLSYLAPQIFGNASKFDLQFTGLYEYTRDVRTFTARRYEAAIQLMEHFTRALTLQYRYAFRHSYIIGTPLVSPELLPLLSQPVRVGAVSTSLIYDRRDNPIDPHRGIYQTADLAFAEGPLGSQTDYGRLTLRNATYYSLTRDIVFARQTSFGDIARFGGLPDIPLAERFFSGGADTERGFPDYQAGPRDLETGFPIGGTAYLFDTEELRFPLIGDNIGGVIFHDMGNVYSSLGAISLRYHQNNLQDFNYALQTGGFGIRYRTPVGPVRLDLAFSPNSPYFFGYHGTYEQLLLGTGTREVQRINRFQFQFSLGQTF